jgi:hypothetical protein
MPTPRTSSAFYRALQRLQVILLGSARTAWAQMAPSALDASWRQVGPALIEVTAAVQLAAATAATQYVPAVLAETGQPDEPEARIRPQAFAGVASDGRDLSSLLEGSVRVAKRAAGEGASPPRALEMGGDWLAMAAQTIATDAARDAVAAEIMVRKSMGWVRMVNPPCCSRCAVLAGRWYSWQADFPRHPRCDCQAIPARENVAGDLLTDPQRLVDRGLVTDLTEAQKARLADGADLTRVLNESRDRWRERMAAERKAAKAAAGRRTTWGTDTRPQPKQQTIHDFMASLTSQVEAKRRLQELGIAD